MACAPWPQQKLGEQAPSAAEQVMLASIQKRVSDWTQMQPVYSDVFPAPARKSNPATPSRC